ncbi:MAG: hypothetical protein KH295_01950 [Clostridiaceae bacterium]|nr:hypothetical protein [Clostridiaceae bacterium]
MLRLDLKGFVRALETTPELETNGAPLLGEGYLTECIALPFLMGKYISFQDIDFEAFDLEDARAMYYHCEEADQLSDSALKLFQPAVHTKPVPQPQIAFV